MMNHSVILKKLTRLSNCRYCFCIFSFVFAGLAVLKFLLRYHSVLHTSLQVHTIWEALKRGRHNHLYAMVADFWQQTFLMAICVEFCMFIITYKIFWIYFVRFLVCKKKVLINCVYKKTRCVWMQNICYALCSMDYMKI